MKTNLFSIIAALFIATAAVASPTASAQQGQPGQVRRADDKDNNYGYDKSHKVTPQEKARWEAAHKNDNDKHEDRKNDDKRDDHKGNDKRADIKHDDRRDDDKRDDRKGGDSNYGYDKSHQVTPQEKARWEAAHKNDNNKR